MTQEALLRLRVGQRVLQTGRVEIPRYADRVKNYKFKHIMVEQGYYVELTKTTIIITK